MTETSTFAANPLASLLDLGHRARAAETIAELEFLLVNDTHALAPYRQATFWLAEGGVRRLSGVVQVEANVPYAQWLKQACRQLDKAGKAGPVTSRDLDGDMANAWGEWLPPHALWLPMPRAGGGLLLARHPAWTEREVSLVQEWADLWSHCWVALRTASRPSLAVRLAGLLGFGPRLGRRRWWRPPLLRIAVALVIMCIPVQLTVMAPGELVPVSPALVRAPLDGVVAEFHVQPNQSVSKGEALFSFDTALLQSRLDVSQQALVTAETEYRQTTQLALSDSRYRAQLAVLTGRIEERRAEAEFLAGQLERAYVTAPQNGIVLFDDPSEWIGRPVAVGERIMRIAIPENVEIEAWVPLADAIPLADDAPVTLYLSASPLDPVAARLRYMAHDAIERPDGSWAYRLRATLDAATDHRIGMRGTAKLHGDWVPLVYWVFRKPLADIRTFVGF